MSTKIYYPAVFQKEDTGYSVWVPDIPGCVSQGDSFEEANNYIIEAIGLCLESYAEHNQDIPKPSSPESIKTEQGQFVSMVMFDPMEYEKAYGNKSVKKTLTIPSWLNTMSEKNNINFSAVLQAALMEKLGLNS